jgi:hypothetical protein
MKKASAMTIFHSNRQVHVENTPSRDVQKVLDVIKKYVPTVSYIVERWETPSDFYIQIENHTVDVWNTDYPDKAKLEFTSYHDDLNDHYRMVDKVKEMLIRRGVKLKDSKCEVTKKIRC